MKFCATLLVLVAVLAGHRAGAQHPNLKAIDSLERLLPATQGARSRTDCLNAIAEEYWWPSMTAADTITHWAGMAYQSARTSAYTAGEAKAIMLLGVAENFRKHFNDGEKKLRTSLAMYEKLGSDFGLGWCNVWLGQSLYAQDKFNEALDHDLVSARYMEKTGDWEGQGKTWSWLAMIYATLGNYDSSFYYCSKSLRIRESMSDHLCVILSYINMGQLYKAAGSSADALDYYHQGIRYAALHHVNTASINWTYFEVVGTIYRVLNNPDSADYYLQKSIHVDSANEMTRVSYGEALMMQQRYDTALAIFLRPIENLKSENDNWDLMRVELDAAKAYFRKNDNAAALAYAQEAYAIAGKSNARLFKQELYSFLSQIYNKLHRSDSAYYFLQQFTALKDSVLNNRFLWTLNLYKTQEDFRTKTKQLALLRSENKAKEDKLKEDNLLKWILGAGILVVFLSGFFFYKNLALKRTNEKLENRGKQAELQQHVAELEMQALRAQMNPHFIFNCLSSINSFILQKNTDLASTYLTRFSRLVRMVLTQSKKAFVGIEDEMEMLCLYLDMEKLRFKDAFDYNIHYAAGFESDDIFVPPLLLQPFAENAVWHGLLHKEGLRRLDIELREENGILTCVIADNGIGRERAAAIKSKSSERRKSMGLQITAERLALLNGEEGKETFFRIEDVVAADGTVSGTKVVLQVRCRPLSAINEDIRTEHD